MGKNTQREARAPASVSVCAGTLTRVHAGRACRGYCDSDRREGKAGQGLAFQFPKSPPLSEFLNDSEAAQYVCLRFSLALSYPVGGRKKKEKIKFQFPSVTLGLCNQLSL